MSFFLHRYFVVSLSDNLKGTYCLTYINNVIRMFPGGTHDLQWIQLFLLSNVLFASSLRSWNAFLSSWIYFSRTKCSVHLIQFGMHIQRRSLLVEYTWVRSVFWHISPVSDVRCGFDVSSFGWLARVFGVPWGCVSSMGTAALSGFSLSPVSKTFLEANCRLQKLMTF